MKYIVILVVYLLLTLFIQLAAKIRLWSDKKERKTTVSWLVLIFLFGFLTDLYASGVNKIWIFPGTGIIGVRFLGLPIEEYLFFIIVPYFALVLYKVLTKYFQ